MVSPRRGTLDHARTNTKNHMMKILLTGGSGLLGTEIRTLDNTLIAPTTRELNITAPATIEQAMETYHSDGVLLLATATKAPDHEKNPELGLRTNIIGTANIALACQKFGVKLVYTSTDYLYVGKGPHKETEPILPPYRFGWSKVGGECAVQLIPKFLIVRLSFGPVPYPWEKVYDDQYNSKLYVDEIAPLVLAAARSNAVGIMNIGGPRTSLADYARRTRPDIQTIPTPAWVPRDTSLDISVMKRELAITDEISILQHP